MCGVRKRGCNAAALGSEPVGRHRLKDPGRRHDADAHEAEGGGDNPEADENRADRSEGPAARILRRHHALSIGGVEFLDKGGRGLFSVDLSTGDYGFICLVPGARDFPLRMMKQFQVG
jgi:hypothetical protein